VPDTEPTVAPATAETYVEPIVARPTPPAPTSVDDLQPGWLASLQSLLATVVIAIFVVTFAVQAFQIPSESMENTLLIGDYLLVDKLRYGGGSVWDAVIPYRQVRRGDIVVFHYPVKPSQHFVKRVIGVPGDHVRLIQRKVWVNGLPLNEPYVRYSSKVPDIYRDEFPQADYIAPGEEPLWFKQMRQVVQHGELVVPEGQYFVMGDNRDESLDSRYWGFVPRANIIGSPLLVYWSVRSADNEFPASSPGDRLLRLAYGVTHLYQLTRWDRTFRLVN
jgi:signal peptidase I